MTESERIDHDRLFKELISTFSDDFLSQFLPDLASRLPPQSLSFTGTELFPDVPSGKKYTADLVAIAQFQDTAAEFVLHIEHQSGSKSTFRDECGCILAAFTKSIICPFVRLLF
jgi:hypothetical protein